jgi:hypothetical protein
VGVEVAGELAYYFTTKDDKGNIASRIRLGLVSREPRLLPYFDNEVSLAAKEFLELHKVELFLGVTYDESFKEAHNFEYVIPCDGYTYFTDFLSKTEAFADCVSPNG